MSNRLLAPSNPKKINKEGKKICIIRIITKKVVKLEDVENKNSEP
jgi:hypothetical protein